MKIDSISSMKISAFGKKVIASKNMHHVTKPSVSCNGTDSVLLYFVGLLSAFGFNKPLNKLMGTLRK